MTRAERRELYVTAIEIWTAAQGGKAQPVGFERVQSSKGDTGHGSWLDWAIDMLDLRGDDVLILDGVYLRSIADERSRRSNEETQAIRRYWGKVRRARLIGQGLRIIERMAA